MTVKGESEKARLKFNIQKMKIIACGPITSCQIDGAKRGNSGRLYLPHFQNHCSHEIKRRLLLGKKAMTNPDRVLKSRDIILLTNIHIVKAMAFPVVMYGCESWTIKETECLRIDAFELWCWRRLLGVPWTARKSNQSILKEINP